MIAFFSGSIDYLLTTLADWIGPVLADDVQDSKKVDQSWMTGEEVWESAVIIIDASSISSSYRIFLKFKDNVRSHIVFITFATCNQGVDRNSLV